MVIKRIVDDELYHHGIIDQKWGVRHGPPYPLDSGSSTGSKVKKGAKPKSVVTSKIADSKSTMYRNKRAANNVIASNKTTSKITENKDSKSHATKAKESLNKSTEKVSKTVSNSKTNGGKFQISDKTKKILIGAGIVAGAIVVGAAAYRTYNIYSKTHFDTALDKVKLQRYNDGAFLNREDGFSSYVTYGLLDKITYSIHPGMIAHNTKDIWKLGITGENMRVPSFEKANKIFTSTFNKDAQVKNEIGYILESDLSLYKSRKMTPANKRRIKLYTKALEAYDNGATDAKSMQYIYDAWNTSIVNNSDVGGWTSTNKIFDAFKQNGYNAIWDNHDIYISGYRAKNPMIVLDKTNLTVNSARRLESAEIKLAKNKVYRNSILSANEYIDRISSLLHNPDLLSVRF